MSPGARGRIADAECRGEVDGLRFAVHRGDRGARRALAVAGCTSVVSS
jgi:hypothetical protein